MSTIAPVINYKSCKAYLPHSSSELLWKKIPKDCKWHKLFHIKWKIDLLAKETNFVMFFVQGILNFQLATVWKEI